MKTPDGLTWVGPLAPHLFIPTPQRPLRAKRHRLKGSSRVVPHVHDWWQLSFSTNGILQTTAADMTFTLPPSRAIWIPPGLEHSTTVVDDATLYTLYGLETGFMQPESDQSAEMGSTDRDVDVHGDAGAWRRCKVLELTDLTRLLALDLDTTPDLDTGHEDRAATARETWVAALIYDELRRANSLTVGVPLPSDKRLRAFCQAMLADLTRHDMLDQWAAQAGASARTVHRLFRQQLGTTYLQWRQQAVLAQALARLSRNQPLTQIAAELGYDSASAFSAMFRRAYGESPREFSRRFQS